MKRLVVVGGQHARIMMLTSGCFMISLTLPMVSLIRAGGPQPYEPQPFVASPSPSVTWHDDFQKGWSAARQSGRPMLIYITSDRCRYCDAMKQNTWGNGGVLRRLRNQFVAIRLSPQQNAEVLRRIEVPAYPMTLIGHPDGKVIGHKIGYQPPEEIHRLMETFQPAVR